MLGGSESLETWRLLGSGMSHKMTLESAVVYRISLGAKLELFETNLVNLEAVFGP